VKAARVVEEDLNLSYPIDLLEVNLQLLGDDTLVGEEVKLAPGVRVERSVIMDGAQVLHPIAIRESLVFPGVVVDSEQDLERRILTPEHTIDCR